MKNIKYIIASVIAFVVFVYSIRTNNNYLGIGSLSFVVLIAFILFIKHLIDLLSAWNIVIFRYMTKPFFFLKGKDDWYKKLSYFTKVCDYSITDSDTFTRLFGIKFGKDEFSFSFSNKTKIFYADCLVNGEKLVKGFPFENDLEYDPVFKLSIQKENTYVILKVENTYYYNEDSIKIYYDKNFKTYKILGPKYKGNKNHKKIKFELIKV